ncbi:MAG: helix-turn-helix domain-containing protein [Treponema sp.]|jgi:transcriptional regulator with XRE-family HTH domain|nr:helix-turn-helix domain-containing protein [Treponema sp.]
MKTARKIVGGMEIRRMFARNLKRLRELQNISQLELSSMTGLTHNFINDIENCKKWISAETLAKFSAALNVKPYQFFLSELQIGEFEKNPVSLYREDFADMFQKVISDWMNVYLPETVKKS